MKTTLYPAKTRGQADYGWLKANYSFSFANYYDPERVQFGALRVLNDDSIDGGRGFDMHHHKNMEIVTIPLSGGLKHKDNIGNSSVIKAGEVQVMSAGSGIMHSEFNASETELAQILQIWVIPNKVNVTPRYEQKIIDVSKAKNNLHQILSPEPTDDGVWIYQDAWFYLSEPDAGITLDYILKNKNSGVYLFVIEGEIELGGETLGKRDAIGIRHADKFSYKALRQSKLLIMEIPVV
jgi:redox-sensitive bicupin YhaK (pirin superfamily)